MNHAAVALLGCKMKECMKSVAISVEIGAKIPKDGKLGHLAAVYVPGENSK